jgi:hypothetical protein
LQHPIHSNPDDPKRQEEKPDKRVKHKSQQRERPAEEKEKEPEKEFCHGSSPINFFTYYVVRPPKVAWFH